MVVITTTTTYTACPSLAKMFDILFGWRKASKCKKLIKRVQCRLKLLKTKRHSIVRQLREDVAQLINFGYEDIALNRAEHLFKDETTVSVYELLENFCEFIIAHLSYIRKHKDCPDDINEAVSSLIFASARCGDLPELRDIRKLFGERYGQMFAVTALELFPGNLVNFQIREKLCIDSVPEDVKRKLVDKIARDYCLRPEILAIEYPCELQQQVKNHGCEMEAANAGDILGEVMYSETVSTVKNQVMPSNVHQQDDMISVCISSAIVEQTSSDVMESPMNSFSAQHRSPEFEALASGAKESQITEGGNIRNPDRNEERKTTASSSESLPQLPEEMIVYLDDILEVQHSVDKEGGSQDQSIFKFKSPVLPKNKKGGNMYVDPYESCSGSYSSSSTSTRKSVKDAKKRTRRRSSSRDKSSVMDIQCEIYYEKPSKRSTTYGSHQRSKHHRKPLVQSNEQPYSAEKRQKQPLCCQCFGLEAEHYCLNNPCYFHSGEGRDNQKDPFSKHDKILHGLERKIGESDTGTERISFPPRPRRRSCDSGDIMLDSADSNVASNDSLTRHVAKHPYLRAMTMPQARSKENQRDNVLRYSRSFPVQFPSHVHPKLPDYDDIAAKFIALKKEHLQNTNC